MKILSETGLNKLVEKIKGLMPEFPLAIDKGGTGKTSFSAGAWLFTDTSGNIQASTNTSAAVPGWRADGTTTKIPVPLATSYGGTGTNETPIKRLRINVKIDQALASGALKVISDTDEELVGYTYLNAWSYGSSDKHQLVVTRFQYSSTNGTYTVGVKNISSESFTGTLTIVVILVKSSMMKALDREM